MNMKTFTIITTITTFQIVIIFILVYKIQSKTNILGVSINPINQKNIVKQQGEGFNFFYEPKANIPVKEQMNGLDQSTYTINSDSLNERFDYPIEKKKNVFRIVTLGDSFTYGLYVDTKDNWTELLEDYLNKNNTCSNIEKFEVINLGVEGYDINYEIERFRKRGMKYKPDLIIWFLVDPLRITEEIIKIEESKKDLWDKMGIETADYSRWKMAQDQVISTYTKEGIGKYQLSALGKIQPLYNGKILFIKQRDRQGDTSFSYLDEFINQRKRTRFHEIVNIQGNIKYHYSNDGHPNQEGHKAIATDVFEYLTKNSFIPCK